MLGVLGRRGVEACISLFAVLGFCYVPLGQHTGFEHAKAVLSTPAAKRAGLELVAVFGQVRSKLLGEIQDLGKNEPLPPAPLPAPGGSSHVHPGHRSGDPKPQLPRLSPAPS